MTKPGMVRSFAQVWGGRASFQPDTLSINPLLAPQDTPLYELCDQSVRSPEISPQERRGKRQAVRQRGGEWAKTNWKVRMVNRGRSQHVRGRRDSNREVTQHSDLAHQIQPVCGRTHARPRRIKTKGINLTSALERSSKEEADPATRGRA